MLFRFRSGATRMAKARRSAGILLYRRRAGALEVFLVHPGGPFWKNRDEGAWSIPKGEFGDDENAFAAARREFAEETGRAIDGDFVPLAPRRQRSGKTVHAWAVEGDLDAAGVRSNLFSMEWPPKSGMTAEFPEVDRAAWFTMAEARAKLLPGQLPFLDELEAFSG
jgi:predicted NUDIX family NTP pyrophosphohydrolase